MFITLFSLVLLVVMFFVAGFLIWRQISKSCSDDRPSLESHSIIR